MRSRGRGESNVSLDAEDAGRARRAPDGPWFADHRSVEEIEENLMRGRPREGAR